MNPLHHKDVMVGSLVQHASTRQMVHVSPDVLQLMFEGEKYYGVKPDREVLYKYGFDIFSTDPRAELLVCNEGEPPVFFRFDLDNSTLIIVTYNNVACKSIKVDGVHTIQQLYRLFTKKDLQLVR